jgi:hypothetical protein
MIHGLLFFVGIFMIVWGGVICGMLIAMSVKANKAMLLVTIPGILIIAFLAFNFACHLFHLPRNVIPHQTQIVNGINWALRLLMIPLLLIKVYEWWSKKRRQVDAPS